MVIQSLKRSKIFINIFMKIAGLEVSERIIYYAQTEYSGPNEPLVDQIWSSIDTSPGAHCDFARICC